MAAVETIATQTQDNGAPPIPSGSNEYAHHFIDQGEAIFLSLDVETGGEYCGILQLSAEICRMTIKPDGSSKMKDKATDVRRDSNTFNEYVKPPEGAIFAEACTRIHGLSEDTPCIKNASDIDVVWSQFVSWVDAK